MPVTEELLESPTPPPRRQSPFGLGFRAPSQPDAESLPSNPLPSPASSPAETLEEFEAELASPDGWPGESPDDPDATPSTGSSSDAVKVELLTQEELQAITRGGVAVAGQKAHDLLATTDGQKAAGLYLTDEDDQANIGDPLANIAARHQGLGGKVNPDTKDLLSALVGLFGYATKQINNRTEARAIDAGARPVQPLPEPVDL